VNAPDHTTPGELLAKAEQVFAMRNSRRPFRRKHDEAIGEIPAFAGQVLRVSRRTEDDRVPTIHFRYFAVSPSGVHVPLTFGMMIRADALPALAGLVAKALQSELDESRATGPSQPGDSVEQQPTVATE
jgi:hypothetical protein